MNTDGRTQVRLVLETESCEVQALCRHKVGRPGKIIDVPSARPSLAGGAIRNCKQRYQGGVCLEGATFF